MVFGLFPFQGVFGRSPYFDTRPHEFIRHSYSFWYESAALQVNAIAPFERKQELMKCLMVFETMLQCLWHPDSAREPFWGRGSTTIAGPERWSSITGSFSQQLFFGLYTITTPFLFMFHYVLFFVHVFVFHCALFSSGRSNDGEQPCLERQARTLFHSLPDHRDLARTKD